MIFSFRKIFREKYLNAFEFPINILLPKDQPSQYRVVMHRQELFHSQNALGESSFSHLDPFTGINLNKTIKFSKWIGQGSKILTVTGRSLAMSIGSLALIHPWCKLH